MGAMMKTAKVWQLEVVRSVSPVSSLSFSPDEKNVNDTLVR